MEAFLSYITEQLNALLAPQLLFHIAGIIVTMAAAMIAARTLRITVERRSEAATNSFLKRLVKALMPVFTPLVIALALAVVTLALTTLGYVDKLFRAATTLAFVWVVVNLASLTLKTQRFARLIALILWSIAALKILGIWDQTIGILDGATYNFGDTRISLLMVIKGIAAFVGLIWTAVYLSRLAEQKLRRTSELTPSVQVLFAKLTKVLLISLAVLIGLNAIGLDLSTLTIFSGAAGLGLGFGLQKVFSNYISGIILLLDRSIKPGDVVALRQGDTFGWVKALGARYVSLITRDGKEHLIPNEMLITSEVENWSHTDYNIRLKIPVMVHYKSNYKRALEILEEVAAERSRVLKQPRPVARITSLASDGISLELRCWIRDPVSGVGNITSQIYEAILDKFTEAGIDIPYPQRDIRITHTNAPQVDKHPVALTPS